MKTVLRVTNPSNAKVLVRFEPWVREYDISAGAAREFALTGPDPADIEVEVRPTEITIHGWTGSVLDGIGLPVPNAPQGSGDIHAGFYEQITGREAPEALDNLG